MLNSERMKWYILVTFLIMGLSVAGLLVALFNLDPYKITALTKYLFSVSLFVALWGSSTLVINRLKLKTDWPDFQESFKKGFIVSLVGCLIISLIKNVR